MKSGNNNNLIELTDESIEALLASDEFIQQQLERFYAHLSDMELANEAVNRSQFLSVNNTAYDLTYPFCFALNQQRLPQPVRLLDLRTTHHDVTDEQDEAVKQSQFDVRALLFEEDLTTYNPDILEVYHLLSNEYRILLGCIEFKIVDDISRVISTKAVCQIDKISSQIDQLNRENSDNCHAGEIKKLTVKRRHITNNFVAGTEKRARVVYGAVIKKLTAARIRECRLRLNASKPAFLLFANALTDLEMIDTNNDRGMQDKKDSFLRTVKDQMHVLLDDVQNNADREVAFRTLRMLCHALCLELRPQAEVDLYNDIDNVLSSLEILCKADFEELMNQDYLIGITNSLNKCFHHDEADDVQSINDDGVFVEEDDDSYHTENRELTTQDLMQVMVPLLMDHHQDLLIDSGNLPRLYELANLRDIWQQVPNGIAAQNNLVRLLEPISIIRATRMVETGLDRINASEIQLVDAVHIFSNSVILLKDEINALLEGGHDVSAVIKQLTMYESEAVKIQDDQHQDENSIKKSLIHLAMKVHQLIIPDSKSLNQVIASPSVLLMRDTEDDLVVAPIKDQATIFTLLNSELSTLCSEPVGLLINDLKKQPQEPVLVSKLNEVTFVYQCLLILEGAGNKADKKNDLIELFKNFLPYSNDLAINMSGCDLSETRIDRVIRKNITMKNVNFNSSTIISSKLSSCMFMDSSFCKAKLQEVDMTGSYLNACQFSDANLTKVNFIKADLNKCFFTDAKLTEVNFEGANLDEANFVGASFSQVSFKQASLHHAQFIPFDKKLKPAEWRVYFDLCKKLNLPDEVRLYNIMMNLEHTKDLYTIDEKVGILKDDQNYRATYTASGLNSSTLFRPASPGAQRQEGGLKASHSPPADVGSTHNRKK